MTDVDLSHVIKEGFGSIHRRVDDFIAVSQHRHNEVITKVDGVSQDVSDMSDRVTRVETRVDLITPPHRRSTDAVNGHVSVTDLKWYLAIASGAIGSTIALLKFMGKL